MDLTSRVASASSRAASRETVSEMLRRRLYPSLPPLMFALEVRAVARGRSGYAAQHWASKFLWRLGVRVCVCAACCLAHVLSVK